MKALGAVLAAALAGFGMLGQQFPPPLVRADGQRRVTPLGAEPLAVLELEKAWAGAEPLLQLAAPADADPGVRIAAVRALGRLGDPRVIPQLLALRGGVPAGARAEAIAQSLYDFNPAGDPDLVRSATGWMFETASPSITDPNTLAKVTSVSTALSRIAYPTAEQVHQVERILVRIANFTGPDFRLRPAYVAAAQDFESLARVNGRTARLEEETAARLAKMVEKSTANDDDGGVRLHALLALIAGGALNDDTERAAVKDDSWEVRRIAATVLAGGGAGLPDDERLESIRTLLSDTSAHVRYEALRAYARRAAAVQGCAPIEALIADDDQHVALAAIDALGDVCKGDEELTDRLATQTRVPPASGSWHRDTHAFVALAKRSPERASMQMGAFVSHPVWWVRMYAAGAAAAAGDLIRLEKLAYDTNDNVREAALQAWRRLKKADADQALIDALDRTDVQLLRTVATLLKDSPRSSRIYRALLVPLARLTKEGKETSRDGRLALLDAIAAHAAAADASDLTPYLKDFDPKIAERAAQVIIGLSGRPAVPEPVPYRRGWPQAFQDLRQCVTVRLGSGRTFHMQMLPASAPVTVDRFLQLATRDRYYDGLTFHRVVPNFVLQAGSPGANEYAGAREFMRDEISARNTRGSVGLSIRGRNTGDAQFYINLVDNPRLNGGYTIFAMLPKAEDLSVMDAVQEGDVIRAIDLSRCQ